MEAQIALMHLENCELKRQCEKFKEDLKKVKNDNKQLSSEIAKHHDNNTCIEKYKSRKMFFEESRVTQWRIKQHMTKVIEKIDEHNSRSGM
jgi:hypothetical protein